MILLSKNWPSYSLAVAFIFAFIVGGATREALSFQIILFSYCWFVSGLLFVFKGEALKEVMPRMPLVLLMMLFIWCFVTLLPLPADWFKDNSIYDNILAERQALREPIQWLTVSVSPLASLRSLYSFGPAVLALLCVSLMSVKGRQFVLYGIVLLGVISTILAFLQISNGSDSTFYYWQYTNHGSGVGIFANANHQGSFAALLVPLFFVIFLKNIRKVKKSDKGLGLAFLLLGLFVIIFMGILMSGSLAAYALGSMVFFLSICVFGFPKMWIVKKWQLALALILITIASAAFFVLWNSELRGFDLVSTFKMEARLESFRNSFSILQDNFPAGIGLGGFVEVYPFLENSQTVTKTFLNHVHNDWLEWSVELGLPGMIILLMLPSWACIQFFKVYFSQLNRTEKKLSKGAALSVLVLALHSFFDYPIRTPFLGIVFASLLVIAVTRPYQYSANPKVN